MQTMTTMARLEVKPGSKADLRDRDPADKLGLADKVQAKEAVGELQVELIGLHSRLWAEETRSVLLVLQGMDTSGKDGAIRKVLSGINPQGTNVVSFKAPNDEALAHDYLWRVHRACPPRGHLGVFNRSHYECVVTERLLDIIDDEQRKHRYRHIKEFERMLADEGTTMVKVFLHISKEEQRERLQARVEDPLKNFKFNIADLETRKLWDDYEKTYDEAITETSTDYAPWHIVPADRKWVRDVAIARLLVETLRRLDPRIPPPDPALKGLVIE
jgi:PPK2 family polyphosphate:nucleotide phosphotransferase